MVRCSPGEAGLIENGWKLLGLDNFSALLLSPELPDENFRKKSGAPS